MALVEEKMLQKILAVTIGLRNQIFFKRHQSFNQKQGYIMKKRILALASLAALLVFGNDAQAATGATANATAKIVNAVSISKNLAASINDLAFGTIIPGEGGTVIIPATLAGVATASANVTLLGAATTRGSAKFTIGGTGGMTCNITVPASVTISNGSANMAVTLTGSATQITLAGVSTTASTADLYVGGTLTVASAQAVGDYTGTFQVDVAYQ